ncbi:MAG: response regulator [Nitrospirae bacterium]|nr:response regulator [Nitrospirota bacterium]
MTGPTIRRRLLVVEDDEMLQDLYRQLLEILGFDAVTIGRAEEAIRFLSTGHVDGVILDLVVPRETGLPVHEWIAQNRPELLKKTVLSSGDFTHPEIRSFTSRHDVPKLVKPFGLADLSSILTSLFSGAEETTGT